MIKSQVNATCGPAHYSQYHFLQREAEIAYCSDIYLDNYNIVVDLHV